MSLATLTSRVDEQDKVTFDALCDSIGVSASAAINMFVKAVIRENKIPFELKGDPFYSEVNQAYVLKSVNELRNGMGTAHDLIEE